MLTGVYIYDKLFLKAFSLFQFSWILNGEPLNENDSRWVVQTDGTLYVPKVYAGKKSNGVIGEYQCLVRNNDGALLSNTARLRVACKCFFVYEFNFSVRSSTV